MQSWQRTLIALVFARIAMDIGMNFISPFLPLYLRTFGITGTVEIAQWIGIIAASAAMTQAVSQPIWGSIADRWGRKPMLIRSMLSSCIVAILMGFAGSPWHLLALRLAEGAFSGSLGVTNALVSSAVPRERLGFSLGLTQVGFFFGSSVGPMVGGIVADTFGFRDAYFVAGAFMLLGATIVFAFVRESFTPVLNGGQRRGMLASTREIWALSMFPLLVGVTFLIQLGGTIVNPILTLVIAELNGAANAATVSGLVIGATAATSAIAAVILGRYSDRIGHAKIVIVCLAGACLVYLPQAFVHGVWEFLALRMLLGIFLGGLIPAVNALVAEVVPGEKRGFAFGLTTSASSIAGGVGPLIAAGITTNFGLRSIFLATGAFFAVNVGLVAWGFYRARRKAPTVPAAA